jgi:Bifunctional DNA primase/polymerase, N-terminal
MSIKHGLTSPVEWALAYTAHGLDIFPCSANKHPLTPNGYLDATRDPDVIKARWRRWPFAEPAWALPPNVVVADLDEKHGKHGIADFIRLEECDPRDVVTPIATTPSGGLQVVYDAAGRAYQNKVAIDGTGIDTRASGGYVVLPSAGNGRKWLRKLSSTPLAPAPVWLDCATKQESRRLAPMMSPANGGLVGRTLLVRAVRLIMTAPQGVQEETRHRQAFFVGTLIAAGVVDYDVAYQALVAAANAMPTYDRPWRNLEQKVTASLVRGIREGGDA